jgi:L-rhamnose-H+ transport protein
MELIIGLLFVTLAGFGTGTTAWPMKIIKDFHFGQYLFVFIISALVLYPWIIILVNVKDPLLVIKMAGLEILLIANLMSICWGVANVMFMICIIRIGAALSGAILSALGMSVGVIMPLILKGSGLFSSSPDLFSKTGFFIMVGLAVLLSGVVLVSIAGFGRERFLNSDTSKSNNQKPGTFLSGLIMIVIAGVLSCGLSLSFVYSQGPIIEAVRLQGASETVANISVWALATFAGAMVNLGYACYLMTKDKSWNLLFKRKYEFVYAMIVGLQFIISVTLMGRGMVFLGALGASIGFGIQQSMQIIGNQLVGFISGEWKGVVGKPIKTMYAGIAVILIAVVILAYNSYQ